jgi:hypothetical protein
MELLMDPWSAAVSVVGKVIGWIPTALRRRRFRAKAEIQMGWDHSPIFVLGDPYFEWRAIRLTVTASKDEEYVVATGWIQARSLEQRTWVDVFDLRNAMGMPFPVAQNRQHSCQVSGSSVACAIRAQLGHLSDAEIRVRIQDHHRQELRSNPIRVSVEELQKEEYR